MASAPFDLRARARQAMLDAGFKPDFPPEVSSEVAQLDDEQTDSRNGAQQDLRALLWSSIDNDSSRDLDQIEYAERLQDGSARLLIGIADVDSLVTKSSAVDNYAAAESTSVYTGVATFPMLPNDLSTNRTSLLDGQDRAALVIELRVLPSGEVQGQDVYRARVINRARLVYGSTGGWLEHNAPPPPAVANTPGLTTQLQLQLEIAQQLRALRKRQGALTFGSIEPIPLMANDHVENVVPNKRTVADDMIESFMVAANVAIARYLKGKGALSIRRVVRTPQRWDRIQEIAAQLGTKLPADPDPHALAEFLDERHRTDPDHFPELSLSVVKLLGPGEYVVEHPGTEHEGHFGLAVHDYSHSTAPNRRFPDLMTQRLLKAVMAGSAPPYSEAELTELAAHCTEREDAARKVERLMRKVVAACFLSSRIGQVFDGMVTGASEKGTYVRLLELPAEGRVVKGAQGIDVSDRVKVRLVSVDIAKGFIDFQRL